MHALFGALIRRVTALVLDGWLLIEAAWTWWRED